MTMQQQLHVITIMRAVQKERKFEACATSYGFYITKWTGMETNTLFFITEGIVT
jgi:hypothetical protein